MLDKFYVLMWGNEPCLEGGLRSDWGKGDQLQIFLDTNEAAKRFGTWNVHTRFSYSPSDWWLMEVKV